jgi:hypothetical protein
MVITVDTGRVGAMAEVTQADADEPKALLRIQGYSLPQHQGDGG